MYSTKIQRQVRKMDIDSPSLRSKKNIKQIGRIQSFSCLRFYF